VERDLAGRIFSTSAQLVGVCLTVIGLFRVVSDLKNINSVADNLMAIDALIFLGSCLLAYLALRSLKGAAESKRLQPERDNLATALGYRWRRAERRRRHFAPARRCRRM